MVTPSLTGTTPLQRRGSHNHIRQPAPARSVRASPRRSAVRVQALFNFLPGNTKVVKVSPKAKQLVEELLDITEGSDIGTRLRAADKDNVEALIRTLEGQGIRAPAKSPLLFGVWEVIYKTKPTGLGPDFLRNPLGQIALQDQRYYQVFDDDGTIRNVVQYKTLGLLPGEVDQGGGLEVTGGNTFKLIFKRLERNLEVTYLDETLRITRIARDEDDEAEESYIVFRRVEDDEEEEEEEEEAPPSGSLFAGLLPSRQEGLATQAERSVQLPGIGTRSGGRGNARTTAGTAKTTAKAMAKAAPVDPRAAAEARRREAELRKAEAAAAAEERRQQAQRAKQDAEAKRREAAAAAEAKKREAAAAAETKKREAAALAEARRREAEEAKAKQAAIKDAIAELREGAKEAAVAVKDAVAELRAFEKEAVAALREAERAQALSEDASERTQTVEMQLVEAREVQAAAVAAAREAANEVKEAERALASLLRK